MFVSEMELLKARLAVGKGLSDSHILRQILQEDAASEKKKRMREGERYYQGEHDILQKDFRQSPISEAGRKPGEENDYFCTDNAPGLRPRSPHLVSTP